MHIALAPARVAAHALPHRACGQGAHISINPFLVGSLEGGHPSSFAPQQA